MSHASPVQGRPGPLPVWFGHPVAGEPEGGCVHDAALAEMPDALEASHGFFGERPVGGTTILSSTDMGAAVNLHSRGGRRAVEAGMRLRLPERVIGFPRRPLVMGIVNVNDDSFSGDGTLDFSEALAMARRQAAAGADVIDVGAESARTNRVAIPVEEEIRRFRGFLAGWDGLCAGLEPRDAQQVWPPVLSVNTWRPEAVEGILTDPRVELVNDMGALPDDRNARLCAAHGAALLVMHGVGAPKVPHFQQRWDDVMRELERFFAGKLALAEAAGLAAEAVVLDPGIDFAKQRADNLTIFRELARLDAFGRPLLVPVSRKTVIGEVLGLPDPAERDAGTIACISASMNGGARIFRVHDADAAWQAVKMLHALDDPE